MKKSCKISGVPDGCILASDVFTDVHSTYFYEIAMSPFRSSDNIPTISQKFENMKPRQLMDVAGVNEMLEPC